MSLRINNIIDEILKVVSLEDKDEQDERKFDCKKCK